MEAHGHLNLLDQEIDTGQETRAHAWRVSAGLLGTLMGGILLLNSIILEVVLPGPGAEERANLLAMIGAILLGAPVVWHAVRGMLSGHSHMDELVALAIIAAFAVQEYRVAGAVGFFMLLAELIQTRTALGARASIESLIRIMPTNALLVQEDGSETQIEVSKLQPGQIIRVRPGDNIPADGRVVTGQSTVNQANITGESLPVDKASEDRVFAGTTNLTGLLDIEVASAGRDTTLGKVQSLIIQAEGTRIPIMRIIDRYIHWYLPTILMIAAIVLAFQGAQAAIAVLVISCPCALILATPTAMVASLSCASRLGILIKDITDLEAAGRLTAMVFDKTGTLTTGRLAVTKLTPASGIDPAHMLATAAAVEQFSRHPVAQAVTEVARQAQLTLPAAENFEEVPGRGVKANIDGHPVIVGREDFLREAGTDMSALQPEDMAAPEGVSLLYVARENKCIGWIGLEDRTRTEARQAIDDLRELGVKRLVMVTGDRLAVARRVAAEMGCSEVKAECLPHEKLNLVHELQREGYYVSVVGDGVNDAPALAAGDLGIAMGAAGSDVAINSASIALMNNELNRLSFLIRLSRVTRRVVTQNLIFGIVFIIIGVIVAAKGWLPTIVAAFLHLLGSLIIVFNSARLVRFGEELNVPPENIPPDQTTPDRPDTDSDTPDLQPVPVP